MTCPITVVVSGLIINARSDGILMAKRRDNGKHFPNMWEIPGGKVKPGEGEYYALRRELREELGVSVIVGPLLSTASFHWEVRLHMLLFACVVASPFPARPLESQKLEWVTLERASTAMACLPSLYSWYHDIDTHLSSGEAVGSSVEIDNGA